jgi:hypothetical protein
MDGVIGLIISLISGAVVWVSPFAYFGNLFGDLEV